MLNKNKFDKHTWRHIGVFAFVGIMATWVIYRFAMISAENNMEIFNESRYYAAHGVPVNTVILEKRNDVLYEPISVRRNVAYVPAARVSRFGVGMSVGDGKIVSVSSHVDIDSGMYVVRTQHVPDGVNFAAYHSTGYFVPIYAVQNDKVFVARSGVAHAVPVRVVRDDATRALITGDIHDGDIVITSNISDGDLVQIGK